MNVRGYYMARPNISKTLVWILMGLLILGLGGFGVTNLSGTQRKIGSVGDVDITVQEYYLSLNQGIREIAEFTGSAPTIVEAIEQGLQREILNRLVSTAAVDHENAQIGISVGDGNLRDQIISNRSFHGLDGAFDREAYVYALENSGLTEARYEEIVRNEMSRGLVEQSVMAAIKTNPIYPEYIIGWLGEQRDMTWVEVTPDNAAIDVPEPSEEDIVAYHEDNSAEFTSPEKKLITYAWLTPDMLAANLNIQEDLIRDTYENQSDRYSTPEFRLVERLIYSDAESASKARESLDSGESSFEDLVAARGLALADIDMGEVTRADIGEAGDSVFEGGVGDVVGPIESGLGPAMFRVNGIIPAIQTTYEEAREEIGNEIAEGEARTLIERKIETIEDLLAGGATIEELSRETDMELGSVDWHVGSFEGIAIHEEFQTAANEIKSNDYPTIMNLNNGGIFSMRLEEIIPSSIKPLDEVREEAIGGWKRAKATDLLAGEAEALVGRLNAGSSYEDLELKKNEAFEIIRQSNGQQVSQTLVDAVFDMVPEEYRRVIEGNNVYIVRLETIREADLESEELSSVADVLERQIASSLSNDQYKLYVDGLRERTGIKLDNQAINAVHANFQ